MITIIGDLGPVKEMLSALKSKISPRVMLELISARLVEYMSTQFSTRGQGKWKPLSELTKAMRKRGGDVPLQDTGHYRMSWQGQPGAPIPSTDNESFVQIGSSMDFLAGIHEGGTKPYTIRATKNVLSAMLGPGGAGMGRNGRIFFGKEVHHPGIPPRPVLPTKEVAEALLISELEGLVESALVGH